MSFSRKTTAKGMRLLRASGSPRYKGTAPTIQAAVYRNANSAVTRPKYKSATGSWIGVKAPQGNPVARKTAAGYLKSALNKRRGV